MGYRLGLDLGTTYTAAAVERDGHAEVVPLGDHSAQIPSALLLQDNGTWLVGDAAVRRGSTEPERLAHAFKRRLGDTADLWLGDTRVSAVELTARLLRWTVDDVTDRQGEPPQQMVLTLPASWGSYRRSLFADAVAEAGVPTPVSITEPVAAAVHFAAGEQVREGELVAVYDLGGGTFDAAVLRRGVRGFDLLGTPQGLPETGGVDFDDAVFTLVEEALGSRAEELYREDDPAGLARLRRECTAAKEALSTDDEVVVPVVLRDLSASVRLERGAFEDAVRDKVTLTVDCLERALLDAGTTPQDLKAVLLVGGSARLPLVRSVLSASIAAQVRPSPQPKLCVALGAAVAAADAPRPRSPVRRPAPPPRARDRPLPAPTVTPERPRMIRWGVAAAVGLAAAVVLGAWPTAATEGRSSLPDVQINGQSLRAGSVSADLSAPLVLTGPQAAQVSSVSLSTGALGSTRQVRELDGSRSVSFAGSAIWIAGPVRLGLQLDTGNAGTPPSESAVLVPDRPLGRTVPEWGTLAVALFVVAYIESLLRNARTRSEFSTSSVVALGALGALAGLGAGVAAWAFGDRLLAAWQAAGLVVAGGLAVVAGGHWILGRRRVRKPSPTA